MSLLPEPSTFEKRYSDDEKLASELPDRPITSLRDLQYVYGRLYTLATAGGGEYAAYLTPENRPTCSTSPRAYSISASIWWGDKPRLDPDQPIGVESYGEEKVEAVAHSWYNAAKGFDHSVHRTGKNKEPEKVAEYLHERLTAWAADDVIQEAVADHEDGWIVDALAELGESEDLESIETAVEEQLDGKTTALSRPSQSNSSLTASISFRVRRVPCSTKQCERASDRSSSRRERLRTPSVRQPIS